MDVQHSKGMCGRVCGSGRVGNKVVLQGFKLSFRSTEQLQGLCCSRIWAETSTAWKSESWEEPGVGQKPKGLCGQGRNNLWGAAANTSLCSQSHGLRCHGEQSSEEHPSAPHETRRRRAGKAQPQQRSSCFMAQPPRPHHPNHFGAPKVNPFPRTVHSHFSKLWREDNCHPLIFQPLCRLFHTITSITNMWQPLPATRF